MPGIACLRLAADSQPSELVSILSRVCRAMRHAPWHHVETRVMGKIALGRVSLRIFNPSPQPLLGNPVSIEKTVALVMDGELHTALLGELTHIPGYNDAEAIMHLYLARGMDALNGLQGSFSLILWDSRVGRLIALTDRYATRPLYYSYTPKGLVVASEVEGVLATGWVPRRVNKQAVTEFFTFRHPLGDKTLVEKVHILPPAACLVWDGETLRVERYWDLPLPFPQDRDLNWHADRLAPLLKQAVARQVKNPLTGISLSGGLDSRLLAGVAAASTSSFSLHTFTNGRLGCPDHRYAQQVADRIGSRHHTIQMTPDFLPRAASLGVRLTDGLMTCLDFYSLNSAPVARETEVGALIFGLAGPLGGIALRRSVLKASSNGAVDGIYHRFGVYISEALQRRVLTSGFFQQVKKGPREALREVLEPVSDYPASYQAEFFSYRYRLPRTSFYGPTLVRNWVEVRLPYYDYTFYDAVSRVPPEIRSGRKLQIALLKALAPSLAQVPWTYTNLPVHWSTPTIALVQRARRRLCQEISFRTRGMIPPPAPEGQASYAAWFRGPLHNWLEEMLLGERTIDRGYYNPKTLRTMVDQHIAGVRDYSLQFGLLITFELWNRLFIDGDKLPTIEG